MKIRYQVVALDAADLEAESAFWAGVLGGDVDRDDGWHMVTVDGEPRIGVQYAPNHVPPDWPDGSPPQQVHLDLWVRATTSRCTPIRQATRSACASSSVARAIPTDSHAQVTRRSVDLRVATRRRSRYWAPHPRERSD
jgi:hypothetical protein